MTAKELISDVVPAVRKREEGMKALNWMEFFRISHIPVIDGDNNYVGIISDNEIYDLDLAERRIDSEELFLDRPFVTENQHIYEIIEIVSRLKLSIMPVVDKKQRYIGVITIFDIVHEFGKLTAIENPGALFVLELNGNDYSLSQIAQIIESNDAKVLSLYVSSSADSTKIEITIKISATDFSAVRQTLERYDYSIKAAFSDADKINEMLEQRYEEFMFYLNL